MEEYWCHICKAVAVPVLAEAEVLCSVCHSAFLEKVDPTIPHPRLFVPFSPAPSAARLLTNLLTGGGLFGPEDPNLDAILHHIMMNDSNRYGPPPASTVSLANLPEITVDQELVSRYGSRTAAVDECGDRFGEDRVVLNCCVCRDEFELGTQGLMMPCEHIFHPQCLTPWLKQHNSCPTCRYELPTDDSDYEHMKRRRGNS